MSGRVLVTGSSGFVGTRLCAHLQAQGYEVFGCDQVIPEPAPNRSVCDITDRGSIGDTLQWSAPVDAVLHLPRDEFQPTPRRFVVEEDARGPADGTDAFLSAEPLRGREGLWSFYYGQLP